MDMLESFQKGLDLHQPDWWITYANAQEMVDYIRDCSELGRGANDRAKIKLRRCVAGRLMMPVRAAIDAGLVIAKP